MRPDPAAASGLLAMADGLSIVLGGFPAERNFPKLDEVRNIRKKVLRRNDSVTIAGARRAEKR